jgi:pseudoazurin
MTMKIVNRAFVAAAILLGACTAATAADFEVQMRNKGADGIMVFEPSTLKIAEGDTVTFLPTDKSHNAETIPGLLPDGATPFKGKMNESVKVTFDVPGAYAIKCAPHLGMGMVALVVVGDAPANLDGIKEAKLPKKARERMDADIAAAAGT